MRLELGCGARPTPGYVHHDRFCHAPHVDRAFDLESVPWPLADDCCSEILALDVFEHLRPWVITTQQWLDECWRILRPGGLLEFRLPAWNNPLAFSDPTHYMMPAHHERFLLWCPDNEGQSFEMFGRYYFGPSYCRWWHQESCVEDPIDLRWRLRKLTGRGPDGRIAV